MVLVRETMMADWQAWRDIRLQALRDAPDAFSSTYAEQNKLGEDHWRQRVAGGGLFLAWIPEVSAAEPAGMAAGCQAVAGTVELVSMFVRPQARGRGVGEALIDAVTGWARERGATSVHLWVTETNKHARLLYERCGFSVTAERQPLPSNPALGEVGRPAALTRPLEPAPGGYRGPQQAAHRLPDVRVVEQVEVVHSAVPAGLFDRERDMLARAAPPVGAGGLDQQVADQGAQRAVRVGADDGADRVVARAGEQWHVGRWLCWQPSGPQAAQSSRM